MPYTVTYVNRSEFTSRRRIPVETIPLNLSEAVQSLWREVRPGSIPNLLRARYWLVSIRGHDERLMVTFPVQFVPVGPWWKLMVRLYLQSSYVLFPDGDFGVVE